MTVPAIAGLRMLAEEIAIAREHLAALVEETNFELWEMDAENDLLGLTLTMGEWVKRLDKAAGEIGL